MRSVRRFSMAIQLTLLAAILIPAWMIYSDACESMINRLSTNQLQICQTIFNEVRSQLRMAGAIAGIISDRTAVQEFLSLPPETPCALADQQSISRLLDSINQRYPEQSGIYLFRANSQLAYAEDGENSRDIPEKIRPDVQLAIEKGKSSVVTLNWDNDTAIFFISPVIRGKRAFGAVAIMVHISLATRETMYTIDKKSANFFLLDAQRQPIFATNPPLLPQKEVVSVDNPNKLPHKSLGGGSYEYKARNGDVRIGVFMPLPELNWIVGASVGQEAFYKTVHASIWKGIALSSGFTILSLVLVTLFIKGMLATVRQRGQRLEMLIEAGQIGLWEYSAITHGFQHNPMWGQITGFGKEEKLRTMSWLLSRIHPSDKEKFGEVLHHPLQDGCFSVNFRFLHADGSWRWYLTTGFVHQTDKAGLPELMEGTLLDRTIERQAYQNAIEQQQLLEKRVAERTKELETVSQQALEASRAKSAFLSTISHEIRTPMNAIIGFINIFKTDNLVEEQRNQLGKIDIAAKSLLYIINDVLDISKIESGKLEIERAPFRLVLVVDTVCSIVGSMARAKELQLTTDIADDVPEAIMGDAMRLQQVLLNLLNNAVKFTNEGTISLNITAQPYQSEYIISFVVSDTGIGISTEQAKRLFQPFSQADSSITRRFGGTGLGLAISKQLIELMGGSIAVESNEGEGSTFRFTILASKVSSEELTALAPHLTEKEELQAIQGAKILVVEDNVINMEIARIQLEDVGMNVYTAVNGQEAVNMVKSDSFDLVFMDMQMPVMDGVEACRIIRDLPQKQLHLARLKDMPIVAMTANAMTEDRKLCLEAGMDDHLSKPFEPETLYAMLLKWIPVRTVTIE